MSRDYSVQSWVRPPEVLGIDDLEYRLSRQAPRVRAAVEFARRLHGEQLWEDTELPYVYHPLSVAAITSQLGMTSDDDVITAILCNAVDRGGASPEEIGDQFGQVVRDRTTALSDLARAPAAEALDRLRHAPGPVRIIAATASYHRLLTVPEQHKAALIAEAETSVLPALGKTLLEATAGRLLCQLIGLRRAGGQKMAMPRDSAKGRRIEELLHRGIPLVFDGIYRSLDATTFATRQDKADQIIFMVAFIVTAKGQVGLFERSSLREKGGITGEGLLAAVRPFPEEPTEVGVFRRLSCPRDSIREIRPLGQGFTDTGSTLYVFELFDVVLRRPVGISLLSAKDRFTGFSPFGRAAGRIGPSRELDRDLLSYLQGETENLDHFVPARVGTSIQEKAFLGMDIVTFSTMNTYSQVDDLLLLHECLRAETGSHEWTDPLVFSPTGDGCFLTAHPDDLEQVLGLIGSLRQRIDRANADLGRNLRLRFGLNIGPAFRIYDINGAENMIGDGINMAARMLGGKDPWEMNVPADVYHACPEFGRAPRVMAFHPARLPIKHFTEPIDVFRCLL